MFKDRRFPKELSLREACELLKVSRTQFTVKKKGESKESQIFMEEVEEICLWSNYRLQANESDVYEKSRKASKL